MISLSHLNKLTLIAFFFTLLTFSFVFADDEEAADIWKQNETQEEQSKQVDNDEDITVESPILSSGVQKMVIKVNQNEIGDNQRSVIGIFDPEENNFNLDMWSQTDGADIKKVLKRIDRLELSKLSEDLLFQVLFTNAYSIKKHKIKKKLKNIIFELIKNTGFLIPHLRNHHIILAKKIKNINELTQIRKTTTSKQEWFEIRKNILGE